MSMYIIYINPLMTKIALNTFEAPIHKIPLIYGNILGLEKNMARLRLYISLAEN